MSTPLIIAGITGLASGSVGVAYIVNRMRIAMVEEYWKRMAALQIQPDPPNIGFKDSQMVALYRAAHMSKEELDKQGDNAGVVASNDHKTITVHREKADPIVFRQIIHKDDRESSFDGRVYVQEKGNRVLIIPKGLDKPSETSLSGMLKDYATVAATMVGIITKQDRAAKELLHETLDHPEVEGKHISVIGYSLASILTQNLLREYYGEPKAGIQMDGFVFANLGPTVTGQDVKEALRDKFRLSQSMPIPYYGAIKELEISDPIAAVAVVGPTVPSMTIDKAQGSGHFTNDYLQAAIKMEADAAARKQRHMPGPGGH